MTARRIAGLVSVLLLASGAVSRAQEPAQEPEVRYRKGRVDISLQLPRPRLSSRSSPDGRAWTLVELEGHGTRAAPGEPVLPVVQVTVDVPRIGVRPRVLLGDATWEETELEAPPWPRQASASKRRGALRPRWREQTRWYRGRGRRSPDVERAGTWYRLTPVRRSRVDGLRIELFLYSWDPSRRTIRYPTRLDLAVSWTDGPRVVREHGRARKGPVSVVAVRAPGPDDVARLVAEGFDISGRREGEVVLYVDAADRARLEELGVEFRLLPTPGAEAMRTGDGAGGSFGLGEYHDYEAVTELLSELAADHPDRCLLRSIGQSREGREIWAVKVSDRVDVDESEPEIRLAATLHGDEAPATEIALYLLDHLLRSAADDPRVTALVESTELWVLPLLNPDGRDAGTRHNAAGVDLNRAFPDRILDPVNSPDGREPEVAALMRFCAERQFVIAANLHTGEQVVNYPYDANESGAPIDTPTPDDALFRWLALRYASPNPDLAGSREFPGGITNGADWYVVHGSLQDWSYVWEGTFEFTVEISAAKWPPASRLPGLWEANRESLLAWMESVETAVAGTVRDEASGAVIPEAQVMVGADRRAVGVDPVTGSFHRILEPGQHSVTVWAPGYAPETVSDILVHAGRRSELAVELRPLDAARDEAVLIVAPETLSAGVDALERNLRARGRDPRGLVVPGGLDAAEVRSRIVDAYHSLPFRYLLLVGDVDLLPTFERDGHVSDLLYSLVDPGEGWDDIHGRDLLVGRLPFRSDAEIDVYCGKLLAFASSRRDRRFVWISQGSDASQCGIAESTHRWVIEEVIPEGADHQEFPCGVGTLSEFLDAVDAGVDVVTYSGHGDVDAWHRWSLGVSELALLGNEEDPPVVLSHGCSTARFEAESSLGEAWLETDRRAVAFIGATADTYWDEDDWLEKEEFRWLTAETPLTLSEALWRGLEDVARRSPEGGYYHQVYHLLGDPTLRLRGGLRISEVRWEDGGNGVAEPGESATLSLRVLNDAGAALHDVVATVEVEGEALRILSGPVAIAAIEAGDDATVEVSAEVVAGAAPGLDVVGRLRADTAEGSDDAAFSLAIHVVGLLAGRVTDDDGGPIHGAGVVVDDGLWETVTGADGSWAIDVWEGTHRVDVSAPGYFAETREVTVPPDATDVSIALGWAEGTVFPTSLRLACAVGEEREATLSLRNRGSRPLPFRVGFGDPDVPVPGGADAYRLAADDELPAEPLGLLPGATVVHFGSADDEIQGPLTLSFPFPFYGGEVRDLWISTNGCLAFWDHSIHHENRPLPDRSAAPLLVAALWDDLVIGSGGSIRVLDDGERCVVQFDGARPYADESWDFSFRVTLHSDGAIELDYGHVPWLRLSATVGLQDGTRTRGLSVGLDETIDGRVVLLPSASTEGAPSSGGYSVTTPGDVGGPVLSWVDMSGALVIHQGEADDEVWGPFDLPFAFPFFGQACEEVFVGANGFVTFAAPGAAWHENDFLPSPDAPALLVAAAWDDLVSPEEGAVRMLADADRCVIEFDGVSSIRGTGRFSAQVLLERTGGIVLQYRDVDWTSLSATVGVQDGTREQGLVVPRSALSRGVVRIGDRPAWLDVLPREGVVEPGGVAPLTVRVRGVTSVDDHLLSTLRIDMESPRTPGIDVAVEAWIGEPDGWRLLRGDSDQDEKLTITDAIVTLSYLFRGLQIGCPAAADTNGDDAVDISDPIATLVFLFLDSAPPAPPWPECGPSPTLSSLPCPVETCPP